MKNTQKFLAIGSTSAFLLSATIVPAMAALEPMGGSLDDLMETTATEAALNTAIKVTNLSVLPGDKKATLMWDPVKTENGVIIKYKISYGTTSVEEGFSDSYEKSMTVELDADEIKTVEIAKSSVSGLKNGEKYFFSVQAIDADGEAGSASEEKFTTPSIKTQTPDAIEEAPLSLSEATALTTTVTKVIFSKDVTLPEDTEARKKLFTVNTKADEDEVLEIKDVVFKDNYLLDEEANPTEKAEKGTEIYIVFVEAITKDTEYQITASARLKDVDGKGIDNGVTDNVFFTGTDATEIPASENEKPEISDSEKALLDDLINETDGASTEETEEADDLHAAPHDTTAPEEITNLQAKLVKRIKDFVVNLTWKKSKNTAGDLVQQLLYTSSDNGKTWGTPKKFNGDLEKYTFTGTADKAYTVKITTKDRSGNESKGVIKTVKVPALVSSGAPLFLALGLALLGGGATVARRKEKLA